MQLVELWSSGGGTRSERTNDQKQPKDTKGRRGSGHSLFYYGVVGLLAASNFDPRQIIGSESLAQRSRQGNYICVEPYSIRGIAFLWFIGVLRDRLAQREDRLFATVFLGSGLLFLAMLFSAAAVASAIVISFSAMPHERIEAHTFDFARILVSDLMNIYAIKMAGVFMISTSTVVIYTQFAPRYIGLLGYVLAPLLLFGGHLLEWSFFVFPIWILLLSIQILVDSLRGASLAPNQER